MVSCIPDQIHKNHGTIPRGTVIHICNPNTGGVGGLRQENCCESKTTTLDHILSNKLARETQWDHRSTHKHTQIIKQKLCFYWNSVSDSGVAMRDRMLWRRANVTKIKQSWNCKTPAPYVRAESSVCLLMKRSRNYNPLSGTCMMIIKMSQVLEKGLLWRLVELRSSTQQQHSTFKALK